jgi:hypothetical protein
MNKQLVNPFDEISIDKDALSIRADQEPLDWSQFAQQAFLTGEPTTAEELVGKTFDIMHAKKFDSSFDGQDHAWYCVVRPVGQDQAFAVTLGGQAVIEVLDAYAASGGTRPLRVKLGFKSGGKFKGYYQFE